MKPCYALHSTCLTVCLFPILACTAQFTLGDLLADKLVPQKNMSSEMLGRQININCCSFLYEPVYVGWLSVDIFCVGRQIDLTEFFAGCPLVMESHGI